jgi:DegV family protein with EDD domain
MENIQKVALITDSSCDLSQEMLDRHHIHMLPLRVVYSKGEFRDRLEISENELYSIMEQELPKTSLPFTDDVAALYTKLREEGTTHVIHISISSGLSGTYNMIRMITKEFENDMEIALIDSKTLSTGLGLMILAAAEALETTGSFEKAVERAEAARETQLGMFIIKTLEFLRKGGRIGLVEGVIGTILQLKPVIYINSDGVYQTLAKARGYTNALDAMIRETVARFGKRKIRLTVVHGSAAAEAQKLMERLKELLNVADSFISSVSPVLAVHTGPGLLGIVAHEA